MAKIQKSTKSTVSSSTPATEETIMTNIKKSTKPAASTSTPNAAASTSSQVASSATSAAAADPNAALEQYVLQAVAELDSIEVDLGVDPPLSPVQKRHAAKLRKGGGKILGQIANLALQEQWS